MNGWSERVDVDGVPGRSYEIHVSISPARDPGQKRKQPLSPRSLLLLQIWTRCRWQTADASYLLCREVTSEWRLLPDFRSSAAAVRPGERNGAEPLLILRRGAD